MINLRSTERRLTKRNAEFAQLFFRFAQQLRHHRTFDSKRNFLLFHLNT